ncbi:hypothetical protein BDZ91DRAFT_656700 [Kalaharituber pfeilii]|nr:hypothetical protein BDZ91DRAFT_656700 [Kalaharituber pfeilii]
MSSGPSKNVSLNTKSANSNNSLNISSSQLSSSSSATENHRRGGSSGAAALARSNQATPRGNQSSKKSHVDHRRARKDNTAEELAQLDYEMAASGASRKGTSITHLMNWNLPPRPQEHHYNYSFRSRHMQQHQRRNPTWGLGSGYHAVDKARYVHANYRFVVNPAGDYRAQAVDSDVHVPWEQVLQVLASAKSQTASCPICLCVPVAPRMAKCGHIFCLPCLMRYMASVEDGKPPLHDKKPKYKKCPICWDSVYMKDVRPVRWFTGQEGDVLQDGMEVVLRLMGRRHGSTLALPRDRPVNPEEEADGIPWYFSPEVADFARLMKGTRSYMEDQFKQEIDDLIVMGKEDELMFNEEGEWTRKAIAAIKDTKENLEHIKNVEAPLVLPLIAEPKPERPQMKINENLEDVPDMYFVTHAARSGQVTPAIRPDAQSPVENISSSNSDSKPAALASIRVPDDRRLKSNEHSSASYYFYRALPHYYLSPFDIRILKSAFGMYEDFPTALIARVEGISTGHSVDDEFRRKMKYLAHLPYGTEVAFLECDWRGVVPEDVLERFKGEIERRRKRRKDKEVQEERERERAEKEGRHWVVESRRREDEAGTSTRQRFSEEDFVALAVTDSTRAGEHCDSPPLSGGEGAAAAGGPTPGTSPVTHRTTVWGTPAVARIEEPIVRPRRDDGWADVDVDWERDYLLEEDLLAHQRYDEGLARTPGQSPMNVGKGANKKKKKKVVLMNNGGKRGA